MSGEFSDVLARWLERDVLPNVIELEHADAYPTEMVEQMREFGLFGATIPTEYGGLGLSTTDLRRDRHADLRGVDVAHRRPQLASDDGAPHPDVRHRRAARGLPPEARRR